MTTQINSNDGVKAIDDPLDLERLRLSQDFGAQLGLKKKLTTVPVRKPDRQSFVRVRPGEGWRLNTAVLEFREESEIYLVDRPLWAELPGEIVAKALFTTINRQGVLSLWPVRLPGEDGRIDEWNRSALAAAEMAEHSWIRIVANRALGAYESFEATGDIPDPVWPDVTFKEILEIAFKERFIRELDHPAIRRLRGKV